MKKHFTILIVLITLCTIVSGQSLPNYLPSNGLVGWWPFNGNANDESGNGNNGTVNGATLITDRFGNANKAYSFDGLTNEIVVPHNNALNVLPISISVWFRTSVSQSNKMLVNKYVCYSENGYSFRLNSDKPSAFYFSDSSTNIYLDLDPISPNFQPLNNDVWHNGILIVEADSVKLFIDGLIIHNDALNGNLSVTNTTENLRFGSYPQGICSGPQNFFYDGIIDDIGIWNRALTQQEISDLYNTVNCANDLAISPVNNQIQTGNTAILTATTNEINLSYFWQSDLGQGFQTLLDFGNYSGTNTSSLNISNIQLANHNQPIRVITTSGECVDTSDIATISILDTCITSINDTTFITVTDTLVINTLITGINPPNNSNTIKVYPNPANSHITIEYGDFAIMNGYQLRIENSLGQEVFQTNISQQSDYLNLNSWGGNGLYFVHIVDPQGNTIDIRKIVLQ
jgi:hypothetical protein